MPNFGILVVLFFGSVIALAVVSLSNADVNINILVPKAGKRIVCYFGSWSVYRPGAGKFDVENIDPFLCTHLIFGFAGLSFDNRIIALDSWNDEEDNYGKGAYRRFTNLKQKNSNLKTLLAIGGWNEGSEKYSKMAASVQTRRTFIDSLFPLLSKYNFDGLDLDWEYPAARGGKPEDKQNFATLCREIRADFDKRGWILTSAVSAGEPIIADAYDVPSISRSLDFINVMTYDFHGAWEKYTGHHSPLAPLPTETGNDTLLNMKHAIEYWIAKGSPPDKLNLGFGSYGRGFILDDLSKTGFYAPASQGLPAGPYTRETGFWGYNEICERLKAENWNIVRDQYYQAPYAYSNNLWIGYDDAESIRKKSLWALQMGLGGVMLWSVETDDFQGTCGEVNNLMKTMYRSVQGEIPPQPPTTTPIPNLPTTTTKPITSTPPSSGKCSAIGQIIAEKCDEFFTVCNWNGNTWDEHVYYCTQGLSYDPKFQQCNWDDQIPCPAP